MGETRFTDRHHCVTLVDSLCHGHVPYKGTDPDDTKVPVHGENAVASQTTAPADPQPARLLPISPDSIRSQGT
jgi:hypothetical protein